MPILKQRWGEVVKRCKTVASTMCNVELTFFQRWTTRLYRCNEVVSTSNQPYFNGDPQVFVFWFCLKIPNLMFLNVVILQCSISSNIWNFEYFLNKLCPMVSFLKMVLVCWHCIKTSKFVSLSLVMFLSLDSFSKICCVYEPSWVFMSRFQLVRNHFLRSLPKNNNLIWCNLLVFSDEVSNLRPPTIYSSNSSFLKETAMKTC